MFFIGNRFKKSICLFLNPIVELSVIPIKYVSYTNKICLYQRPLTSKINGYSSVSLTNRFFFLIDY